MIHLRSINTKKAGGSGFPYTVPVIQSLELLEFTADITFFVGENGSGKSTLLESIACAVNLPTVGSSGTDHDDSLAAVRNFSRDLGMVWSKRTRTGFFMRSEDFFGFVRRISETRAEMHSELERVDKEYEDRSDMARNYARMAFASELHALKSSYGEDLDANSHGESYFTLFQSRFKPGGLYLLDEPEAPLSPMRQLTLIAMLKQMVDADAQFIISTHSPILLAYPGATIYSFEEGRIEQVAYDDLEHVNITRSFLNNPEAFLRHLLE